MNKNYIYIFIREDLDPTYQIIQASHATFELGLKTQYNGQTCHFCLLRAKDEKHLLKIQEDLGRKGIDGHAFFEPDFDTGYTALAYGPIEEGSRKAFRKYRTHSLPNLRNSQEKEVA